MTHTLFTRPKNGLYYLATLALFSGLILTTLSWLNICTQECAEEHNYRLFGFHFETLGFVFFIALIFIHFLSLKYSFLALVATLMLASALGGELLFVLAQKYIIHAWCPVCLGIALSVAIASLCYGINYLQILKLSFQQKKGELMKSIWPGIASLALFTLAFCMSFVGLSKFDQLQATEVAIKEQIKFGNPSSPIEVFLFTDWACPACRQLEPKLADMVPTILKNARFTFVDFVVHPETLNYTPYNLSFMVNNKSDYLKLRQALDKLAEKTGSPKEEQIQTLASNLGLSYKELNYADIAMAQKYFKDLGNKYRVEGTPTVVIVNTTTQKGKKLEGIGEISTKRILEAIESVK